MSCSASLAQARSFTKTGETVGFAQSAVSHSVRDCDKLEAEWGGTCNVARAHRLQWLLHSVSAASFTVC